MAEENTKNSNDPADKVTIKLDFTQNIINNIIKAIVGVVLTPKVTILFLMIYKIVYGEHIEFKDVIQFIKQNKQLFKSIIKRIVTLITTLLLGIVLKHIAKLMAEEQAQKQIEKAKNKQDQMLSLVGVSQEALQGIKSIKGLT